MLVGCADSFQPPRASAAAENVATRRTRIEGPRERQRFLKPMMPPERRRRTGSDRRTGARPNRKTGVKPGRTVRTGPGAPSRKAAYSSQRKLRARPRAAAAAIAVAAEEERRLRQRNRLALEEDKPAVERCLEELVFGDVEDNEDALLRRLRGPRVREAVAIEPSALGGARGWAVIWRRSLGDLRRRRAPLWEGAGEPGRREGPAAWRGRRPPLSPPCWGGCA